MNFEEILNQWEMQTQRPYGKKRIRKDAKGSVDYWLRRYGVYDKDSNGSEDSTPADNLAEKRRLRTMRPQAEIDLHGMTLEEAYSALVTFFDDAVRREYQKVLIIHGKGNHSQNGPVLARFVQKFLETNTHAGETGHPKGRDGGTGSTWVILK